MKNLKDVKLIQVKDLLTDACELENLPLDGTEAGVFYGEVNDPDDLSVCYNGFRRLKSLSLNLTIEENGEYIEFDTTAEETNAENVGSGQGIFKDKTGETLNFRSLTSSDSTITITQSADGNEIDLKCPSDDVQIPIFIKGVAKDIGKANPVGFNYPRQVIWSDHNFPVIGDGGGLYGSVFLVPFRMKIDTIRIKWRMREATDILNSNNDIAWDIGKLTDPGSNGVCDTEDGTVNYTPKIGGSPNSPSFTGLSDLTISFTNDNAKWPLKVQTISDDLIYEAGDALVFLHDKPTTDWGDRDSDCEVVLSGFYTPSTNGSEEPEEEEESNEEKK